MKRVMIEIAVAVLVSPDGERQILHWDGEYGDEVGLDMVTTLAREDMDNDGLVGRIESFVVTVDLTSWLSNFIIRA